MHKRMSHEPLTALAVLVLGYARQNARHAPGALPAIGRMALGSANMGPVAADVRATPGVLRSALDEALGDDWHARVDRPVWRHEPDLLRRTGMLRVATSRRRYAQAHDQLYGEGRGEVLDIWSHPQRPSGTKAPMVLQIPGGAWVLGGKRGQGYPLMRHLANHGWVCASMSYRLAPRHPWPAHIVDVKRAIAWLRTHADELGGDPDFIVVTGGSAGGHLAALAALTPNDPAFQPGFEDLDTGLQAAVPLYGRYDWVSREGAGRQEFMHFLQRVVVQAEQRARPEVFRDASPILRVTAEAPPFFVIHGSADRIIPVEQAQAFVQALRAVSEAPVAYAELPGAQHGFDLFSSRRTTAVCEAINGFLGVVLGDHRLA